MNQIQDYMEAGLKAIKIKDFMKGGRK